MAAYTTIDDPEAYFQVQLYTGNGSANNAITLGGDTNMQPDLVWIKNREQDDAHCLFDSVRGATKLISSDANTAESTDTDTLDSFTSDGFQVDADVKVNTNAETYVAWCWKESATSGFDIVSYTGNGTDDTDISHSLSAVPKMIIVKNRDAADSWQVYHHKGSSGPETDYLVLDTTAAIVDAADRWSDEAPTSSVFTLGDGAEVNTNTENYIAYLFTEKQGFSKVGSYEGSGDADGPFIYTGFRPAWVMTKNTVGSRHWGVKDTKRSTYNVALNQIDPDADGAAFDSAGRSIDILSNGFKIRTSDGDMNADGENFVYVAFAEAPFVNSKGVPCNAR